MSEVLFREKIMSNFVLVTVGGPDAAVVAMNNEAVGRHFRGDDLNDPEISLQQLEGRAEREEGDIFAANDCEGKPHRRSVFLQYYYLQGSKVCREEVLSLNRGRSVSRNEVACRKHPQYYEGVRIH